MWTKIVTLGVASLAMATIVVAQATQPLQPAQLPPSTAPADATSLYRFQVDDVIRIDISHVDANGDTRAITPTPVDCTVLPDGNISAPFIGLVHAEGRTLTELYEYLKQEYTARLFLQQGALRLTLTPMRIRQIRATILGAVLKPGSYTLERGDKMTTLLALAQGAPTDGSADLRRATLRHAKTREVIPIDMYDLLTKGDTTQDYEIQDGDTLTVPQEVRNRISVDGEVKQPQVIPYAEGLSVAQAITRAGGRTDNSKMTKVTVVRLRPGRPDDPEYITVNLVDFYNQRDRTQNIELKPGDTVYVPNNGNPNLSQLNSFFNFFYLLKVVGFNPLGF